MVKLNLFPFTSNITTRIYSEKYNDGNALLDDFVLLIPTKYIDYTKPNQPDNTFLFRTTFLSEEHYLNGKKRDSKVVYTSRPYLMADHIKITVNSISKHQYSITLTLYYFWATIVFIAIGIFGFYMFGPKKGIIIPFMGFIFYLYSYYYFRSFLTKNLKILNEKT